MAMFSEQTLQKIRAVSFYNIHLKRSSAGSKILVLLYPDKKYSEKVIADKMGLNKVNLYITLSRLVQGRLVKLEKDSKTRFYSVTQEGRWFAICSKLDLRFLSLCALADAYEMQTRLEKVGQVGFYVFPRFAEIFEGIYSQASIRVAFEQLKVKNLAFRYVKKSLRIKPKVLEDLRRYYQNDLEELQKWIAEFQDIKDDLMRQDQNFIQRMQDNKKILTKVI